MRRIPRFLPIGVVAAALVVVLAVSPSAPHAASPPPAPAGLTAIALDGHVALNWQPADAAQAYALFRGTSPTTITQRVTPLWHPGTSFSDTTAANGTTYYYAVRAYNVDGASVTGQTAQATPRASSCATGNAITVENCFPGTTAWKSPGATTSYPHGIEGFLSASSVDAGDSVELRVRADWEVPYHVEIYRTGHYAGDQGRLVSVIPDLRGELRSCFSEPITGIADCAHWPAAATISTTADWTSGVYLLKLVREDNGEHSEALLVVRDDGGSSDVLYGVPTSTYQAYNTSSGKSMYDGWSDPPATVSGGNRAVEVSFDRPYAQPTFPASMHDWYTRTDIATVSWLEQQGYETSYIASEDLHANGAQLQQHEVFISGSHDEYWSTEMFDAAISARNAGTSLIFMGANAVYWKVRFKDSASTGRANRVMVGYKSIQSGPPDPSGDPTTTWRDPTGPNRPENELIGQQYVGENIGEAFPLQVSAAEGRDRTWRYTPLNAQAPGTSTSVGSGLVGWEWDARANNGREPAGVRTLATTPVTGNLIQGNGANQAVGSASATATLYEASSGARVFSTGTNDWWRGLARNVHGQGEPDSRIRQSMVNVLADMGARPTTLSSGLSVDALGAPAVSSTSPAANATSVPTAATVRATVDRELDPETVDTADFTLRAPDGTPVSGSVSLDNATRTVSFDPDDQLESGTAYTARLGTGIKSWAGASPAAAVSWTFSTGAATAPAVLSRTPAPDATVVPTDTDVRVRFDRRLDPASLTPASFSVRPAAGGPAVVAQLEYDSATRTARLTPDARLASATRYTAELTTGIRASDGLPMAAGVSWDFTTGTNLQVTGRTPAASASGISPAAVVRAVFSRPVDAATITDQRVRLRESGGSLVSASVTYDAGTRTAMLSPATALLSGTAYTVEVDESIRAADGAPLDGATWTFTTAATAPPAPATTSVSPAAGAAEVSNTATIHATFDRALDPATLTTQSFTLTPEGGAPAAATVTYDAATQRAVLRPLAALEVGRGHTATLTTAIRSATGAPLATTVTWSFTTAQCPCSLMDGLSPATTGIPVHDWRPGPGPFTYELGTKVTVTEPADLVALRFHKDPAETGTHVGRVWDGSGQQLASVTYAGESTSGWQRQALTTPLRLLPGQTYTISVGLNRFYGKTVGGLQAARTSGPLRTVADGRNGVFNESAGAFPSDSWASSSYLVDGVVRLPGQPARTPQVTAQSPTAGAAGVSPQASVAATFSVPLDSGTVNTDTFTVTDDAGDPVSGTVSYDEESSAATFTPADALETGTAYTARLSTGIRSDDETPLAAPVSWTFATVPPAPPAITAVSPADGTSEISPETSVTATFSQAMDAASLDSSSFTLTGPSGAVIPAAVTYDAGTRTVTLTPGAPLAGSTPYLARVTTGARSARGIALQQPEVWSLTTSACPCRLFGAADEPAFTGLDTANGRGGAGPWSLEMGVKVRVTQPSRLEAVRFYKSPGETGAHVGRVWSATGQQLREVTFSGESASGWQEQSLAAPLQLAPGQTYVVSVGMNARFTMTRSGLAGERSDGPLRSVADGANGVYSDAAGVFPTNSWSDSNYFVDAVAR